MAETASPRSEKLRLAAFAVDILFFCGLLAAPVASLSRSLRRIPFHFLISVGEANVPAAVKGADIHTWSSVALAAIAIVFIYMAVLGALYFELAKREGVETFGFRMLGKLFRTPIQDSPATGLQGYLKRTTPVRKEVALQFPCLPLIGWFGTVLAMVASFLELGGFFTLPGKSIEEIAAWQITQDSLELVQLPLCFIAVTLGFWFMRRGCYQS